MSPNPPEMSTEEIDRRYAELFGLKKPKYARTETDERALKAAQAKRQLKADKRLVSNVKVCHET
jgi:hypothetical protein